MIIIYIVFGALIGIIGSVVFYKAKDNNISRAEFEKYKTDAIALRSRLIDVESRLAKTDLENKENIALVAAANEKILAYEDLRENIKKEFKEITSDMLEIQKKSVAEEQIKTINPVREQMEKLKENFDKQIKDMLKDGAENKMSLEKQLGFLRESTGVLQKEAAELAGALKNKKQQGNWGEFQLERIFEILGFVEGREYNKEVYARSDDGSVRPDYVLNLPNNRRIIIDSKLSLESYIKHVNSEDENDKKRYLREFIAATKQHITTLGSKEYQNKLKDSQLDYVFMFMPLEHSYLIALEEDPGLYQFAFNNNVAITTPSLLFPMMRTIDTILKIDKQDKNIEQVIDMVNKLYEKYVGFTEDFDRIDKQLITVRNSYDSARGKLVSGAGNMSGIFHKIQKKSGIKSTKVIALKDYDEAEVMDE